MNPPPRRRSTHPQINAWFIRSRNPETGAYPDFPEAEKGGSVSILNPPLPTIESLLTAAAEGAAAGGGKKGGAKDKAGGGKKAGGAAAGKKEGGKGTAAGGFAHCMLHMHGLLGILLTGKNSASHQPTNPIHSNTHLAR
jgi:hypothetical protein